MRKVELVVVGGGPAGMAAALEAYRNGVKDIVIIERDEELGGILRQCIHNGFGLHFFGEELTGPEYAWRFIEQVAASGIEYRTDTMVLSITQDKIVTAMNTIEGLVKFKADAVILAMGCRERTRGALSIPGSRPAGIYTAGTAQRFVNIEGYLPGRKIVILGSGDIGLIMARRMTLEGAEVKMVCEVMPYPGGLRRNIVQCLNDFNIPLRLSHTVVKIHGKERLEGVTIARVDENRRPIPETAEYVECDTLLLSVGLIPENELSRDADIMIDPVTGGPVVDESMETSVRGIFACGNAVHVHDLVDNVTAEAMLAGKCAALSIVKGREGNRGKSVSVLGGDGVRYVVPQLIRLPLPGKACKLFFRVNRIYDGSSVIVKSGDEILYKYNKLRLTPGEMESVTLPSELLNKMSSDKGIVVEIENKSRNAS